jgi:hypothetical protein
MKGFAWLPIIFIVAFIGIIVYAGGSFVGIANLFRPASVISVGGQTCADKGSQGLCPLVGFYSCEMYGDTKYVDKSYNLDLSSNKFVQMTCDVWTPSCSFKNTNTGYGQVGYYTSDNPGALNYLSVGQSVSIDRTKSVYFGKYGFSGTNSITESYQPYTLYRTSPGGGKEPVPSELWGCNLPGYTTPGTGYCTSDSSGKCIYTYTKQNFIIFNGNPVNFVDIWVNCPISQPHFMSILNEYCAGAGHLYKLENMKFSDNSCYTYPGVYVGDTPGKCCPGDIMSSTMFCDNNGNIVNRETNPTACQSCFSPMSCTGNGHWIQDPAVPTQSIIGTCDNSCCKYTTKQINTGCTGNNILSVDSATGEATCRSSSQPPVPPTPQPSPQSGWSLTDWIMNLISAMILSAGILGVIFIIYMFTPLKAFVPFVGKLKQPKIFIIATIILAVLFLLIFYSMTSGTIMSIRGSIFGG